MQLTSDSISQNSPISSEFALCLPDPQTRITLAPNRNPQLSWCDAPAGTRSFVLLCHDPDVPSVADDVNQEDKHVPANLPRIDFFHWVLVDIPATSNGIAAGEDADGVTARGKEQDGGPQDARRGLNSYTDWFAGDADMEGDYFGYDGPCPPWNDSIKHRYIFTLYALDIEVCPVEGKFGGPEVRRAIDGHILAQASITATYSLNPDVMA